MMKKDITVGEFLLKEMTKSVEMRNPSRYFYYYSLMLGAPLVAVTSWESFRGSWAYSRFLASNKDAIEKMIARDNKRFPGRWRNV